MNLKKISKYILFTVVVVAVIDIALGLAMKHYVRNNEMRGDYRSLDYLLKDFENDALILGSSVALNSLDPVAIGDSLNLDVYNGGSNGQTLTYHLALLKSVLKHHVPKVVILGIKPQDLAAEGQGARINLLSPYYGLGYEAIDSVFDNRSALSKAFMQSSLYRYNTIWFRILLYNFVEPGIKGSKGFIAKDVPPLFPQRLPHDVDFETMTDIRRAELSEIIKLCSDYGIKLAMFFPPQYVHFQGDIQATPLYQETRRMLNQPGMKFYDDVELQPFVTDSTLFYDESHFNAVGARLYTDFFISRLDNDSIL